MAEAKRLLHTLASAVADWLVSANGSPEVLVVAAVGPPLRLSQVEKCQKVSRESALHPSLCD